MVSITDVLTVHVGVLHVAYADLLSSLIMRIFFAQQDYIGVFNKSHAMHTLHGH